MNTIVIFFSRADENYFGGSMKYVEVGNTEIAVGHITELTGFDSFKLEMVQPYSADYMTCIDEAKAHLRENARPELKEIPDVSDYHEVSAVILISNSIGEKLTDTYFSVFLNPNATVPVPVDALKTLNYLIRTEATEQKETYQWHKNGAQIQPN